jgi:hypothetical protein
MSPYHIGIGSAGPLQLSYGDWKGPLVRGLQKIYNFGGHFVDFVYNRRSGGVEKWPQRRKQ